MPSSPSTSTSSYAPIYRDAHMLLRPRTALKDMEVVLDPGTKAAGEVPSGGTLPEAQTQPDVNSDEVLVRPRLRHAPLPRRRRGRLRPGRGAERRAPRKLFVAGQPAASQTDKLLSTFAARREQIAHLVHNLDTVASDRAAVTRPTSGERSAPPRRPSAPSPARTHRSGTRSRCCPGRSTRRRPRSRTRGPWRAELQPAARELTPAVHSLGRSLKPLRPLVREATPIVRDKLRPFVAAGVPAVRELRPATSALGGTLENLPPVVQRVNYIANELIYNPPGPEEGYGFWTPWFFHNAASMISTQDAHGAGWRGLVVFSCSTLQQLATFLPHTGAPLALPAPKALGC